jgi:uncharacterized membrane protein
MKKADYQMIGYILTALGIFLLVGAVFAFSYPERHEDITYPYSSNSPHIYDTYPYRDSFWTLLIVGTVLLVVGLGVIWRVKQETKTGKP